MFQTHPCRVLSELFARKPYQGAMPESARFLFVGLDANYAANIEHSPIFAKLLAYHEDGPAFWHNHGVHHPFLLLQYTGDGRRYHRSFAKIGFLPEHAELVSFIELLHLPTVGRSSLVPKDLDSTHLRWLRSAVFSGRAKYRGSAGIHVKNRRSRLKSLSPLVFFRSASPIFRPLHGGLSRTHQDLAP